MAINRRKFLRASGGAAALAASSALGGTLAAAPDAAKPERAVDLAALPKELPVIPVRDKVYFPRMTFPLFAGRDRTLAAIDAGEGRGGHLFLTAQKEFTVDTPGPDDLYATGTIVRIIETERLADGTLRVTLEGIARARVREFLGTEAFLEARVQPIPEIAATADADRALARSKWAEHEKALAKEIPMADMPKLAAIEDPGRMADVITPYLKIMVAEQQAILETASPQARLERVVAYLAAGPSK